jgi:hypothetical protein
MGLFKTIARGAKRLARSAVVKGALRAGAAAATGGQSEAVIRLGQRALTIGKQIGAKQKAGRLAKEQGLALNAAIDKLDKMPKPDVKSAPDAPREWNVQDQSVADLMASKRAARGGGGGGGGGRRKRSRKAKAPKGEPKPKKKGPPMSEETKKKLRDRPKKAKKPSNRKLTKGMLDFKAMAAERKASKSDLSWAEWRKKHPIYVQ